MGFFFAMGEYPIIDELGLCPPIKQNNYQLMSVPISTSLVHTRVHDAKPLRKIKHRVENLLMVFFPGFVKFLKIKPLTLGLKGLAIAP